MANQLAALTPVKYSLKLVDLLYNDTLYRWITNTKYEGMIKDSGDRVRVRTMGRIALSPYTKGMTLVRQDLNPTYEDLVIDQQYYFKFGVDVIDEIQNDINAIAEYAANTKMDVSEVVDTDLLNFMRKNVKFENAIGTDYSTGTVAVAATTGVVTGTGTTFTATMVGGYFKAAGHTTGYLVTAYTSATSITITDLDGVGYSGGAISAGAAYEINAATPIALTSSNVYGYLVQLSTVLSQALTNRNDRFIVVNAAFEGILRQSPQFIPAVQSAYEDVVKDGNIGKIAGFKVYTSELIAGNNTTGYWFVAGTRDFCSFALQILKTSVIPQEADPNSFEDTCKGLAVWGRQVFEGTRGRGATLRGTIA